MTVRHVYFDFQSERLTSSSLSQFGKKTRWFLWQMITSCFSLFCCPVSGFSSIVQTNTKQKKELTSTTRLFRTMFPSVLVRYFLRYVCPSSMSSTWHDVPRYDDDHDPISISWFEPKRIHSIFSRQTPRQSVYLRWMDTNMHGVTIGFLACNSFDVDDEFLSVHLGDLARWLTLVVTTGNLDARGCARRDWAVLTATSSSLRMGMLRTLYRRRSSLFKGALIKRRRMCDGALK